MSSMVSNVLCPGCQQPLQPSVLTCGPCGVRVEGPFHFNEFASLAPDDLHLLRIFVMSEGRVRDMEAPLGLSYPTIRSRLSALREKIAAAAPAPSGVPPAEERINDVLEKLQRQELSFDEAMKRIRVLRGPGAVPPRSPRGKR